MMSISSKFLDSKIDTFAKIVAVLIFLQALFFSIFVTPLADIPDESGHFAYVMDIPKGRPLPILGKTDNERGYIPSNIWWNWEEQKSSNKRLNYIVQHPPFYYFIASIPYSISKTITSDKKIHAHTTRIVSAASLGLLALVIFKILTAANVPKPSAILMSTWPALLPMSTHLGSGITNDIFLTLLCGFATLYLVKFLLSQNIQFAYYCALWLALAGATKMTAWIFIGAALVVIAFELRRPFKSWMKHTLLIYLISLSTPFYWMFRNLKLHGDPFKIFIDSHALKPTNIGFLDFFQQQPFVDWLFKHTYSLHGFTGYCSSAKTPEIVKNFCIGPKMEAIQSGPSLIIFIIFTATIGGTILFNSWMNSITHLHANPRQHKHNSIQSWLSNKINSLIQNGKILNSMITLVSVFAMLYFFANGFKLSGIYSNYIYIGATFLLGATVFSIKSIFFNSDSIQRISSYGVVFLTTFTIFLFLKAHEAYSITSAVHGIQGRYLFPYIPLFIASIGIAFKNFKYGGMCIALITILLAFSHLNSYLNTFIPFFNSVRL